MSKVSANNHKIIAASTCQMQFPFTTLAFAAMLCLPYRLLYLTDFVEGLESDVTAFAVDVSQ